MNKEKEQITRREFLKVAGLYSAAVAFWPPGEQLPTNLKEKIVSKEPNPLMDSVRLPSLEYHDPNFIAAKDSLMTPEVFTAQLDWLKTAGYHTPTAGEIYDFLKGEKLLPHPAVAIRFDLGVDKLDKDKEQSVWLDVFENLKRRNQHALIFLIHSAVGSIRNGLEWRDIAKYVKSGTISVCSHGLKDHPDYKTIHHDYAIFSMKSSREELTRKLKEAGVENPKVLAFAFPFDSVPDNPQKLVEETGYLFYMKGVKKNGMNAANFGNLEEGLPCIYPYVYKADLEGRTDNANNFLPLLQIKGGLNFIESLVKNGNEIPFDKSWTEYNINLGKPIPLPENEMTTGKLVNPQLIIIHTDSQKEEIFEKWNSQNTFYGLNGERRKILTNFGVDQYGPAQFTGMYQRQGKLWIPEPGQENQGAKGIPTAINIEMAGTGFDEIFENGVDPKKKEIILKTLSNTAGLVINLLELSNGGLTLENVIGHSEATIRGKSDPGEKTMNFLRNAIWLAMTKNINVNRK
jgi:hypothetical protein